MEWPLKISLTSVHRMLRVLCHVFMSRFYLIPGSDLFVYEIWICSLSFFYIYGYCLLFLEADLSPCLLQWLLVNLHPWSHVRAIFFAAIPPGPDMCRQDGHLSRSRLRTQCLVQRCLVIPTYGPHGELFSPVCTCATYPGVHPQTCCCRSVSLRYTATSKLVSLNIIVACWEI